MKKIDSLISPQTQEFVKLCRRYFEYLGKLPDKKISDFWFMQLQMLSDIYSGIFHLPSITARYSSEVDKFVTEREYNLVYSNLVSYIGALDKFFDFNDLSHPGALKVVEVSLSEILTDIYQELKDFVVLYDTGTLENMNDAIADCFDTFGRYWGVKLLSATRIIHVNLFQQRYAEAKKVSQLDDEIEEELAENDDYDEEEL